MVMRMKKSGRFPLAIGLATLLLLVGCSPVGSEVETSKNFSSTQTIQTSGFGDTEVKTENIASCESGLKVIFLNVGKGDAILLRTAESTVLIDTGYTQSGQSICDMLLDAGVTQIDALIISHFDKDHVGGAATIIRYFNIQNVYQPDYTEENDETAAYQKALATKGIQPIALTTICRWELDGVSYELYPAATTEYADNNDNNISLLVRATYGEKSFLFTGDIEGERVSEILSDPDVNLSCDVLKVPYHGIFYSGLVDFFKATGASYSVITSSDSQREDNKTVKKLTKNGILHYLTREGTVVMTTDGQNLLIDQLDSQ
jgi:beta-lactamase superfamily II metal-dependent hydrolase